MTLTSGNYRQHFNFQWRRRIMAMAFAGVYLHLPNAAAAPMLNHVTTLVNGERRIVQAGEQLDLISGDTLVLQSASVGGTKTGHRASLNLVGFRGQNSDRSWDDIGATINTATDLIPALAIKPGTGTYSGNKYVVRCDVAGVVAGQISVWVTQPRLRYAEVAINGESRAIRDGEVLTVSPTDRIKVQRFESNVANPAEVTFLFQPAEALLASTNGPVKTRYEFVFSRKGRIFAKIPVRLESRSVGIQPDEHIVK